jgi:hypothetical protein
VNWRAEPEGQALRGIHGLPPDAFDLQIRTLARISDDPYDPVFSSPVPDDPGSRVADLGDNRQGFIEFAIDEANGLLRVYRVMWTG